MARFIGYVKGNRGEASRIGHATSGLEASAQGWHLGARVIMHADEKKDEDNVSIYLTSGSSGNASSILLGTFRENEIREPLLVADALEHTAKILREYHGKK